MVLFIYFLLILFTLLGESTIKNTKNAIFFFTCVFLVFYAGGRDYLVWPDTIVYKSVFDFSIPTLDNYTFDYRPYAYSEKGFILLSVICKSIYNNSEFFFGVVCALTMLFLYRSTKDFRYALPLVALYIYICRFYTGRNMIQIRAGLAIAIMMCSLKYVYQKKLIKYLIMVYIGTLFHRSMLIFLPFYLVNYIHLKKKHIYFILIGSFILGVFFTVFVHQRVEAFFDSMGYSDKYTTSTDTNLIEGQGWSNPMIYFQTFILLVFVLMEEKLKKLSKYYYLFRDGYLYSTSTMIILCSYNVICGRVSTPFATLEIFIIPLIMQGFQTKSKWIPYFVTFVVMSVFFVRNYGKYIPTL